MRIEVSKYLAHSLQRNRLVLVKIHRLHFDPWTVLHWLRDFDRKLACADPTAVWTLLDLGLVLRHFDL